MKRLLTSVFVLGMTLNLTSCGVQEVPEEQAEDRIGQSITVDPEDKFSTTEVSNLKVVCDSLSDKEFLWLDQIRNNVAVNRNFNMYTKSCGETQYEEPVAISAELVKEDNELEFNITSGSSTYFQEEVLVANSAALESLCQAEVSDSTERYKLSGSYGKWIQILNNRSGICGTRISADDVKDSSTNDTVESEPEVGTSYCFTITTAKKKSSGAYEILSVESLEVKVKDDSDENIGEVLKRTYSSSSTCSEVDSEQETYTSVQLLDL